MLRSMLIGIGALLLSNVAMANTFKSSSDLGPFIEGVMSDVGKGNLASAFTSLKPYTIIPEAEFQSLVLNTKAQRDQFGARYGKDVGYECLGEKKLGQSLVRITCIEKTEKHAIPWLFFFYKTPGGWVLNSFFWSDKLPALFSNDQ